MSYTQISLVRVICLLLAGFLLDGSLKAEVSRLVKGHPEISLSIKPEHVGIQGKLKPGKWMPLLLEVKYTGQNPMQVRAEWEMDDSDGDRVRYHRTFTLTPNKVATVWLYARMPYAMYGSRLSWPIRIQNQGKLLVEHSLQIASSNFYRVQENLYLYTGNGDAGLKTFLKPYEQHEQTRLVRGFPVSAIPDRSMGLSAADLMIWAAPLSSDSQINLNQLASLDKWVTQGGHLVIGLGGNLPHPIQNLAKENPGLSPLMMEAALGTQRITGDMPRVMLGLGALKVSKLDREAYFYDAFTVNGKSDSSLLEGTGYVVLHKDNEKRPLVLTKQVGLGRVTYLGIDLTQMPLQRMGLPVGTSGFWQKIMSWQRAGFTESHLKKTYQDVSQLAHQPVMMGGFLDDLIAMRQAAGPALLILLVSFAVYWLVAGPGIHGFLKNRERRIYSWYFFALASAIFSILAWVGAKLMNPGTSRLEHYSVVSSIKQEGQPELIKVKSYLSLLVPEHRTSDIKLNTYAGESAMISSPGDPTRTTSSQFQFARIYDINCSKPSEMSPPMRATAKSLEINGHFLPKVGDEDRWQMPAGTILQNDKGNIDVDLVNRVPASVEDLKAFIVWPGEASRNLKNVEVVNLAKVLKEGEKLQLTLMNPKATSRKLDNLVYQPLLVRGPKRKWQGSLGNKLSSALKNASTFSGYSGSIASQSELLSFFDVLPLDIKQRDDYYSYSSYRLVRNFGREFDLSAHLRLPSVILIGHVKNSDLPLQLEVDGTKPDATGRTMVQWIYPIQDKGA